MRNFYKIERELEQGSCNPFRQAQPGGESGPEREGIPERNGPHPTAHQRGSTSPKGERGVEADERSFELGGGGISRLLWTSMTCRRGHRTGRGAQGWKLLTPPAPLVCSSRAAGHLPAACTHPKDKEALCSHRAYTSPFRGRARWRQMGQGEKKPPEAAHSCHPVLSQM